MDSFDPKQREREKIDARQRDAEQLSRGQISREELRNRNGAFSAFAKAPIRFSALPSRGR